MKTVKIIIAAVVAIALAATTTMATVQTKHVKDLRLQVKEQSRVIDSLLTIRHNYINVDLNVTDKSTSKLYGTYNKGTITFPQVRTYKLEIDSVGLRLR